MRLEGISPTDGVVSALLSELRTAMRDRNVYRGHIVSLSVHNQSLAVSFHRLPSITRDQIILPIGVLERSR